MSVIRFEPFRDPFRELDRLMSVAASGTRAPLGMPMDVYRGEDGSYHVEADLPGADLDLRVTIPASPKARARRVEITHAGGGSRTISGSTAGQGDVPAGSTGGGTG